MVPPNGGITMAIPISTEARRVSERYRLSKSRISSLETIERYLGVDAVASQPQYWG
jgi:hypothetical protein